MNRFNYLLRLLLPGIVLLLITCNKHITQSTTDKPNLTAAARKYIDSVSTTAYSVNYRASQPKTIRWDLAQVVQVGKSTGILMPIVFDNALLMKANFARVQLFHLDYLTQLLFYNDSTGRNTARVITAFPDSSYFKDPTRPFTGIKFIEDWLGNPVEKLLYTSDGKIRRYIPNTKQPDVLEIIQTCYTISGYNYSPELDETYEWTEDAGCTVNYIESSASDAVGTVGGTSPGGGGGGSGAAPTVTLMPGNNVIKSIKTYLQCFTNVGGTDHTYTVTVCVSQPDPGTRTPWAFTSGGSSGSTQANNVVNTGHTFLILTETYGSTTITRNVGFYPSGFIVPRTPSSPGQLNDDENHYYNVSGTFTVDNAQFFNILNFVTSTSTATYNLNTNNCTTFAINAMTEGGITLPATIGTWPGGAGDDPGDLGQDMKNTSVPGMTLNITPGYSQPNAGQCN
ncbi:MAG TPA: hypothetical protein VFE32_21460 [Puia sp.]|jgi:hypothetical protein|nr:hypothetical protein [Puia sp.]